MKFTLHTKETAPKTSVPILEMAEQQFGMIPNLFAVFAESPAALHAYTSINTALQQSDLSELEKQVVFLSVSVENGCLYCVGAHSAIANTAQIDEVTLSELRDKKPLSNPKLNALRNLTLCILQRQGWVPDDELDAFLAAGYEQKHILDVITIISMKTLSNYVNHIAQTPLDDAFSAFQWQPA